MKQWQRTTPITKACIVWFAVLSISSYLIGNHLLSNNILGSTVVAAAILAGVVSPVMGWVVVNKIFSALIGAIRRTDSPSRKGKR